MPFSPSHVLVLFSASSSVVFRYALSPEPFLMSLLGWKFISLSDADSSCLLGLEVHVSLGSTMSFLLLNERSCLLSRTDFGRYVRFLGWNLLRTRGSWWFAPASVFDRMSPKRSRCSRG